MLNPNSTTSQYFCCDSCSSPVALLPINADDMAYVCQNRRCQRAVSVDLPEALHVRETLELPAAATAKPTAKWSFAALADAFENLFAELTDEIVDGLAPGLSDERMETLNITWAEILVDARWTFRQWQRALERQARQYAV